MLDSIFFLIWFSNLSICTIIVHDEDYSIFVMLCRSLFVLCHFLLGIAISVLRLTAANYTFQNLVVRTYVDIYVFIFKPLQFCSIQHWNGYIIKYIYPREHPRFQWGSCCLIVCFRLMCGRSLFIIFLSATVFSVLQFMADHVYPFNIFKDFLILWD